MNKKVICILAAIIAGIGVLLSVIMFISAIRFGELGRVILYAVTTIVSLEMGILAIGKLFNNHK